MRKDIFPFLDADGSAIMVWRVCQRRAAHVLGVRKQRERTLGPLRLAFIYLDCNLWDRIAPSTGLIGKHPTDTVRDALAVAVTALFLGQASLWMPELNRCSFFLSPRCVVFSSSNTKIN